MGRSIRALVFDFDGLIVDSESPDYETWREVYRQHGHDIPMSMWSQIIGRSSDFFDAIAHLEQRVGRALDRKTLEARRRERYLARVHAQPLLPGVMEYLNASRDLGLRVGLASSGSCEWVHGQLARLRLERYFQCVRCADDVPLAKPHPELYLSVLECLDVSPHEAIALEDSPNGIRAAKEAGVFCVAVPNPITSRLDLALADLQVSSLADLPLPDLLRQAAERG